MTHFAVLAFLATIGLGGLTYFCLPVGRNHIGATVLFTMLAIGAFVAAIETAGQPKPLSFEWREVAGLPVVGLTWNEEAQKVYVWVLRGNMPVAYVLPWPKDKRQMGSLQEAWGRKGASGDEFWFTGDGEVARVEQPEPMPEKEALP